MYYRNGLGAEAGTDGAVVLQPIKLVEEKRVESATEFAPDPAIYGSPIVHLTDEPTFRATDTAPPASAVADPRITYADVRNIPSRLPFLAGPDMGVNTLTRLISESTAQNPEVAYSNALFSMTPAQIETVRRNVLALKNIDLQYEQRAKYHQQLQADLAAGTGAFADRTTSAAPTLSSKRMAALREQQLREAMFAEQGSDIAFYDEIRRFRPSEAQEQEMIERRGEANANQITETADGLDVARYANGQAVAPPGGVGVPRPGVAAQPGGAAALTAAGLLALLYFL